MRTTPSVTAPTVSFEEMSNVIRSLQLEAGIYRAGVASQYEIPRRIVQFWDSPAPPDEVASLMATWAPMHPGYEWLPFTDTSAAAFIAEHYDGTYLAAYRACQHPAMKSDFFRLAYLYKHGGIYIDADERCLQSIDPLIQRGVALVLRRMTTNKLTCFNNAPLFCVAGLSLTRDCLDWATDQVLSANGRHLHVWVTTGPGNISRMFAQRVIDRSELPSTLVLDDWTRLSQPTACEYKLGRRHWRMHDDRFGWEGFKIRAWALKRRTRLALAKQPLARFIWRALKRVLSR
jgi:hypothetical protein